MIPYGRQEITEDDIRAVVDVLRSDFLTQGPAVPAFESALANWCGVPHAVAVNSATSALHLACLVLGVGAGDVVWTVPNTFVASANCALYCGAEVDFVDIDPETLNISVPLLAGKFARAAQANRLPKVIIPVHFGGLPTDQEGIRELADHYGCRVIEDASHAIGATRNGERVGNCRWSDITIFSFHPVKILTSAEGGVALTKEAGLAAQMALLRSHGITREASQLQYPAPGLWYYEQQALGFNYRMTDLQAALGLSQLGRLEHYVERRNFIAEEYKLRLASLPLSWQKVQPGYRSAYHLFVVRLADSVVLNHSFIFTELRDMGIGVNLHYMPVYLQPYYRKKGFRPGLCPEAERYASAALSLPLYPGLDDKELDMVVAALEKVLM